MMAPKQRPIAQALEFLEPLPRAHLAAQTTWYDSDATQGASTSRINLADYPWTSGDETTPAAVSAAAAAAAAKDHHDGTDTHLDHGTAENPCVVEWEQDDPENPMNFTAFRKWSITAIVTMSVFAITLTSSAYSGSAEEIMKEFHSGQEIFSLGIALFVLGFAVGPAFWAPLSEMYGRRLPFIVTHLFVVAFVAASAGCKNMASLLVFRFLSGTFGASSLTNSGGVIADMFAPAERGIGLAMFSTAPFMGPVLGPIIGGFVTETIGWRWVQGVCCIFIAAVWYLGMLLVPETYAPVLLSQKAKTLSKRTGKVHISIIEKDRGAASVSDIFKKAIARPWVLLFKEPIVLVASTYMAILYGTIYMFMPAFPIVYNKLRGWSAGIGGLAFLGLAVGMLVGLLYAIIDNGRYKKLGSRATPESRLPPAMVGAVALPIGMFAFAWTNSPSIPWAASIILSAPFGFGAVLVFLSCINYLLDAYTIYAASVLAAGAMLRSVFGAAFPLFTDQMFENLGIHWAASIPAFLVILCFPFPFVMYKYGAALRMRCKYAQEAASVMARLRAEVSEKPEDQDMTSLRVESRLSSRIGRAV